ncbi:MAG: NUDIX domain-containing protein [Anaerolineae bacterium]|nr:NUDIX domain-containing protein [Anaerolineae bacterium]
MENEIAVTGEACLGGNSMQEDKSTWPPRIVVCVGAVVRKQEKVLLVRQAEGHSLAGEWSIPWGVVEPGEAPDQAALRETAEESGVTAVMEGLLGYQQFPWETAVALIFLCRHLSGTPTADGIETDAAAYFSLEELSTLGEPVEEWCAWLIRRVLLGKAHLIPPLPENPEAPLAAFF